MLNGLPEETQHRLRTDQPRGKPVAVLARFVMGGDQLDARHGLELAGAFVQHELGVRKRLETGPKA